MKITQEQIPGLTADTSGTAANRPKNERVGTPERSSQTPAPPTIAGEKTSARRCACDSDDRAPDGSDVPARHGWQRLLRHFRCAYRR